MGGEEQHCLENRFQVRRDFCVMAVVQIECSVEMPLCAELGDGEEAGEESANLEEARGEVG